MDKKELSRRLSVRHGIRPEDFRELPSYEELDRRGIEVFRAIQQVLCGFTTREAARGIYHILTGGSPQQQMIFVEIDMLMRLGPVATYEIAKREDDAMYAEEAKRMEREGRDGTDVNLSVLFNADHGKLEA